MSIRSLAVVAAVLALGMAGCNKTEAARSTLELNVDRPGSDFDNFDLDEAKPELCQARCAANPRCLAVTYVKPGVQGAKARCWLKDPAPPAIPSECCVSGVRR